ncbi:MAG: type II toxin-antitoxin system VapC family toxin [Peptococcaceae bacterium]|jgi:predicted nucleic acid-binding protein|nr:type II toxin-antitoxin system VapC family toxin [Peptococcaceae bacterium]
MKSLWIDANVVVRFITGDHPDMASRVLGLMTQAEKKLVRLNLTTLVLAEVVWVLSSFYGYSKQQICQAMVPFLNAEGINPEHPELCLEALTDMAGKNVDFSDAFLAAQARRKGEAVCSFDKDFKKLNVQWVLPPGPPPLQAVPPS